MTAWLVLILGGFVAFGIGYATAVAPVVAHIVAAVA